MAETWTKAELREFDRLTMLTSDSNQLARINGRLRLSQFIKQHGKEKCDAMFEVLKQRDAKKKRA